MILTVLVWVWLIGIPISVVIAGILDAFELTPAAIVWSIVIPLGLFLGLFKLGRIIDERLL
jgi:hypothetical protein